MENTRHRPTLDLTKAQEILDRIHEKFLRRLREKGPGICVSIHEVRGIVDEEVEELHEEVRANNQIGVHKELIDIAVACLLGIASLESQKMDW